LTERTRVSGTLEFRVPDTLTIKYRKRLSPAPPNLRGMSSLHYNVVRYFL
jgi:hypothetical protein